MLVECLQALSIFIRVNLSPDRLEGFDLDFKDEYLKKWNITIQIFAFFSVNI